MLLCPTRPSGKWRPSEYQSQNKHRNRGRSLIAWREMMHLFVPTATCWRKTFVGLQLRPLSFFSFPFPFCFIFLLQSKTTEPLTTDSPELHIFPWSGGCPETYGVLLTKRAVKRVYRLKALKHATGKRSFILSPPFPLYLYRPAVGLQPAATLQIPNFF